MMRLAVLGSPIGHSKSPALHRAAFAALGLDWQYEAIDVAPDALAGFVAMRTPEWRGLSLTMPLKNDILPLLDETDELVRITGAANTVLFHDGRRLGFNTDVYGITQALRSAGVDRLSSVRILGAGATAAAATVAAAQLGATKIMVSTRSPGAHPPLSTLAGRLGVELSISGLDTINAGAVEAVISTVPGSVGLDLAFEADIRREAVLFDVAYDPWPTALAASWLQVGGRVVSGLEMLVSQALMQERIFVTGSPDTELENEAKVLAAMRSAVGLQG